MVKITLPPSDLLRLPFPWNQTDTDVRHEYLAVLDCSRLTIAKALLVLDRSLGVASWLSCTKTINLTNDLEDNWLFFDRQISQMIPEMDKYDSTLIERALRKNGVDEISQELLEAVTMTWIWTFIYVLELDTLKWCRRVMKDCSDSELVELYLDVASSHWLSSNIPSQIIDYLLIVTETIAPQKAIPLLEERKRAKKNLDRLRYPPRLMPLI